MHLLGYRIFLIYDRSYSEVSSKEVEPEPAMIESLRASSELRGLAKCPSLTAQKNTWRDLYLQAIFELERTKIPFRIQEAERALIRREHELRTAPNGSAEREAIINALHCLEALRHCSKISSRERAA